MDTWAVHTHGQKLNGTRERAKLSGEEEFIGKGPEPDITHSHDIGAHLQTIPTLMLAYAKAGSQRHGTVPQRETRSVDSTSVVECPLDEVIRYHVRARKLKHFRCRVQRSPPPRWLRSGDEGERTIWVGKIRNLGEPAGAMVKTTFPARDARREIPT